MKVGLLECDDVVGRFDHYFVLGRSQEHAHYCQGVDTFGPCGESREGDGTDVAIAFEVSGTYGDECSIRTILC